MIVGYRIIIQLKYAAVFPFFSRLTKSQRRVDERQGGNKGKKGKDRKERKINPQDVPRDPQNPPQNQEKARTSSSNGGFLMQVWLKKKSFSQLSAYVAMKKNNWKKGSASPSFRLL